jgi:hypothetical protein
MLFTIPIKVAWPHATYTIKLCSKVDYDSDFYLGKRKHNLWIRKNWIFNLFQKLWGAKNIISNKKIVMVMI